MYMTKINLILTSKDAFVVNKFDSALDPTVVDCLSEIVYSEK